MHFFLSLASWAGAAVILTKRKKQTDRNWGLATGPCIGGCLRNLGSKQLAWLSGLVAYTRLHCTALHCTIHHYNAPGGGHAVRTSCLAGARGGEDPRQLEAVRHTRGWGGV